MCDKFQQNSPIPGAPSLALLPRTTCKTMRHTDCAKSFGIPGGWESYPYDGGCSMKLYGADGQMAIDVLTRSPIGQSQNWRDRLYNNMTINIESGHPTYRVYTIHSGQKHP